MKFFYPPPFIPLVLVLFCICGSATAREAHLTTAKRFLHMPYPPAEQQAKRWQSTRPADAALMRELAASPRLVWLGGFSIDYQRVLRESLTAATKQKALPVFVIYNIPNRDVGGFAKGGNASATTYLEFIRTVATTIGDRPAAVIYEPDAIAQQDLLPEKMRNARYQLFRDAIAILTKSGSIDVYLDAGNSAWHPPEKIATRLHLANIAACRGFALNVSSFQTTKDSLVYGKKLSELTSGKHFIIDTSRNGRGPLPPELDHDDFEWSNPPGRAVGTKPTNKTGDSLCDAYLWVKPQGDSDGEHKGAPPAGA